MLEKKHEAFQINESSCVHRAFTVCSPLTMRLHLLHSRSAFALCSKILHPNSVLHSNTIHSACIQHSFSIHSAFPYHSSGKVEVNVSGTLHTQLVSFMPSSRVNTSNTFSIYYQQNTTTSTLGVMTFTIS